MKSSLLLTPPAAFIFLLSHNHDLLRAVLFQDVFPLFRNPKAVTVLSSSVSAFIKAEFGQVDAIVGLVCHVHAISLVCTMVFRRPFNFDLRVSIIMTCFFLGHCIRDVHELICFS